MQLLEDVILDLNASTLDAKGHLIALSQQFSHCSWVHVALVHSSSRGLTLYLNSQKACEPIKLEKAPQLRQTILRQLGDEGGAWVTEVRLWSLALNQRIIAENCHLPLGLLQEQRKKIKVQISKKPGGQKSKGLGLALKSRANFQTNVQAPIPVPEEPVQRSAFATHVQQPEPQPAAEKFDFNAVSVPEEPVAAFNFEIQEPEPAQLSWQASSGLDSKIRNSVFKEARQAQQLAEPPLEPAPGEGGVQAQLKAYRQRQAAKMEELQLRIQPLKRLNELLESVLVILLQAQPNGFGETQSSFIALTDHLAQCHQLGTLQPAELKQVLRLVSVLRFVATVQSKINENHAEDCLVASLVTLLLPAVGTLSSLRSADKALGYLASQLQLRILTLTLVTSLKAQQLATLERVLIFISQNKDQLPWTELEGPIATCSERLAQERAANQGQCLNLDHPHHPKCPQCQTVLLLGHRQTRCFDCFATITVCQQSLQVVLGDGGAFICECDLCAAQFSKQWIRTMNVVSASRQLRCPHCQLGSIWV